MQRRRFTLAAFGASALPASLAVAGDESWPARPLRWVVPFPPGGTTDTVTRLVAGQLARSLGQAVVVENRPGAGTVIGVDAVAKSPPDGQTLLTVANSYCVNQTLVKHLPYDGPRDLVPVALMGLSEHVLAAQPALRARNLSDLVSLARRRPGQLSYASFGNGTSAHLAGEMLKSGLGIDLIHVPYKGQAPALSDLLAGQVSLMFGNWSELRGHVRSGKLLALGMATARRSVFAPELPTLAEQGLALESNSWSGLLMRRGTPPTVLRRLADEVQQALQTRALTQAFSEASIQPLPGTTDSFAAFMAREVDRYADVIRKAGITAEG
jgi:tripartite-type tricarboxylate transporter receptor subunit TctC